MEGEDTDGEPPVTVDLPLNYQRKVFSDIYTDDGLVVLARGLGAPEVLASVLHALDIPGSLVILLGADEREEKWLGDSLATMAMAPGRLRGRGLQIINSDLTGVEKRQNAYARGGIFSVTSRILIVDMLSGVIDVTHIAGIVVLKAEKVSTDSAEAFILRVYRQQNKDGFIKAFSDQPEPFATGFSPLTSILRNLFCRKAFLWPRFHIDVSVDLESRRADVVEIEVAMTPAMRDIQNAILECIEGVLGELKRANPGALDIEDYSTDAALNRNFDSIVRRQLDPVWHRVSYRSKQLVNDLTSLRNMLHYLLTYDAVSFNKVMETVFETNSADSRVARQNQAPWLFLDAADTIFALARDRVYSTKSGNKPAIGVLPSIQDLDLQLEEQPKWEQLAEILQEINAETFLNPPTDSATGAVLIMCSDHRTCVQVRQYLETMNHARSSDNPEAEASGKQLLRRKFREYVSWKDSFRKLTAEMARERQLEEEAREAQRRGAPSALRHSARGPPPNKRRRVRGGASSTPQRGAIMPGGNAIVDLQELATKLAEEEDRDEVIVVDDNDDPYELLDLDDLVLVLPFDGDMDDRLLDEVRPRHIIMYELDAAFIRRIERYRSTYRDVNLRTYFMFYGGSVEEQRYLSAVRKEKDAFTKLIKEKANMALVLGHDVRVDDQQEQFLRTVNTRIAGGGRLRATAEQPRVVVDVREFRSSLPGLLYARQNQVIPCQLTVGDYILTPDICVERKSVSDLIQSFASGRLYNQCEQMLRFYRTPVVLIEFDQHKAFNLEPFASFEGNIDLTNLQTKVVMLSLAFPPVKFIWSSSPYATAEIIEELKRTNEEPNPLDAVSYGLADRDDVTRTENQAPMELLASLPGVTASNIGNLVRKIESIQDLCSRKDTELIDLIGPEAGRTLYRFLHRDVLAG
ncbi:DNA repair protein RAD16 [Savitreella phatthalungensis]